MYKIDTKKITAHQVLNAIHSNFYNKFYDRVIKDELDEVFERLEKTQTIVDMNRAGQTPIFDDDLSVDQFIDELENFCKYSINESVKSDNVHILDCFCEFVALVDEHNLL